MKKTTIIFLIVLLAVTNVCTYVLASGHSPMQTVTISKEEYEQLKTYEELGLKLETLKQFIHKNYLYEVTDEELYTGALHGFVAALNDPYSQYLTKEEFKSMEEDMEGIFYGVGVFVTGGKDGFITVITPIDDSPAARAGILTDDRILKVDGVEYSSDTMDEAVRNIRGEKGKPVTLTIAREEDGDMKIFDVELVREEIKAETVKYDVMEGNVGYLRVTQFDETTYQDFKDALEALEAKHVKGIVIDLRNNPGGLLHICVQMVDELLDEGIIVYTEDKAGNRVETYKAKPGADQVPIVVLVNKGSASASEIFAGALKDHKRAKLVGEQTFGKGVVQTVKQLRDGDGIKLTITSYFTPSGTVIHGKGIEPDVKVQLPEDVEGIGPEFLSTDTQLKKAMSLLQ